MWLNLFLYSLYNVFTSFIDGRTLGQSDSTPNSTLKFDCPETSRALELDVLRALYHSKHPEPDVRGYKVPLRTVFSFKPDEPRRGDILPPHVRPGYHVFETNLPSRKDTLCDREDVLL